MGPKRKKKTTIQQYEIKQSLQIPSRNCLENSSSTSSSTSFLEDSLTSLHSLRSLHSLEQKGNDTNGMIIGINSIDSISASVSASGSGSISGSGSGSRNSQNNHEALKKFIESGGKKCFELFQYLSSSTHWRKYGTLPPLNDQEAAMLNHMYQLWLQNQVDQEIDDEDNEPYDSQSEDDEDENGSTGNDSQVVSIITCISTIKDTILQHQQYSDSLLTLLTQLDLLMKSPEPCRTHASDLLEILILPEVLDRDVNSLERMFSVTETHSGYLSACSIALGLLAECEHLISSQIPSYETYLAESKNQITEEHYYNNIALQYYLKANQLSSQFPTSASSLGLGSAELIQNSIACMQLGSLYLRGGGTHGELSGGDTSLTEDRSQKSLSASPDFQAAYDYYKLAAVSHNPIAQHKVGYFYDEGLPNGVCNVDIMEAVKWYSLAAELMPDSMHNLAKIYEDGRGGFEPDMTQAVTLYSVAAARGFPLSQVNLGRLFLLGEDGVTRDREAGKRLLTLAAESGDADAQMVVGMIHATPAFECYDLKLSEHWLRQSLAGGKLDAERLLVRVCQQMAQQSNQDSSSDPERTEKMPETTPTPVHTPISQNAQAAKRRGDDFVSHGLLHAAVLEYSRAFELDRSQISYFVDRLDALCILGHHEETLTDSSLLLLCVDSHGLEYSQTLSMNSNSLAKFKHRNKLFPSNSVMKKELEFFRAGLQSSSEDNQIMEEKLKESQDAMDRLYDILVESLGCLFCASNFTIQHPFAYSRFTNRASSGAGMNSADTGGLLDSYNSLFDQTLIAPSSEFWPSTGSVDDFDKHYHQQFFDGSFDQDNDNRQQYQQIAEDYMFNLHQHHREPIVCRLLQDCMDCELKSTKSSAFLARLTSYDRYYTSAVIKFGGIPILLSVLSYPSQWSTVLSQIAETEKRSSTSKKSVVFDATVKKHILHEQLWLNCSIILHNLSFSHMAKKVMYLLSATDGFPIMCNCLRLCRDKIQAISSDSQSYGSSMFRCIALARISTTITQILLSSACLGKEEIWDELMVSDLVGGLSAALECAIHAAQIESDSHRIKFLQQLQHLPQNSIPQNKLQHTLIVRETCLEEVDRILMDTVHTMARMLKIAPTFVLTSASSILMIPFQRILVAITSRPGNSETIYDGLKSATAFCLCKLLCARDPRNAELLQQSLSKDGIRDILMLHESQPDPTSESNGNSKKIKSSNDPISHPTTSIQPNSKGSTQKTTPIPPPQSILNNPITTPAKSNSKKKKGSS